MAKRTRRKFTDEFKAEVVKLVLDGGRSVPEVCQAHQLGETCVYTWVRQAKVDRADVLPGGLTTSEREELAALRRENRELKRERDFFEQATAYFAKGKR